jgi:hypothetical protein
MRDWKIRNLIFLKAAVLFLLLNMAAIPLNLDGLGNLSIYNKLIPGRERLPFGANPQVAYNLSLYNLDAMFASHLISGKKKPNDEFRVILLGDSSVWGTLLKPEDTLASRLLEFNFKNCEGKTVKFFNLGYPTLSITKDLMILDEAQKYQPDLVIWMVTLESLPLNRQLESPLVSNNRERIAQLIKKYNLPLDPNDKNLVQPSWFDRTLWGRRRELADILRLQLYGPIFASTGIDQEYRSTYPALQRDFKADDNKFNNSKPGQLTAESLGLKIITEGTKAAGEVPVVIINEPIMVSSGENSQVRYNFYYPRWAYDQYRQLMAETARSHHWNYFDFWNLIPEDQFTNSAIHLNSQATRLLAKSVGESIQGILCR